MAPSDDLFAAVQKILDTLADTQNEQLRLQVYGRHDARGRFSWDDEASLLAAVADPRGVDTRLVDPAVNYAGLRDEEIRQKCALLRMLSPTPGTPPGDPAMPRLRAGTLRRHAYPKELQTIIAWLKALPFPRA
jgi:hypothetical protein